MGRMLADIEGHGPQCAGNLLWRPTPQQMVTDHLLQRALHMQLGRGPCASATGFAGSLSGLEGIALGSVAIVRKLTADGTGLRPKQAGDGLLAQPLLDK